jgi:two-component system, NarL family, nitrate/nitrite response regulator NarL
MICVHLISDVRLNREALASLIKQDGRVDVASHAAFAEAVEVERGTADVVLVDTSQHDGPEAAQSIVTWAEAPIVALAVPEDEAQVIALAEMGVLGFLEADADLDDLVAGVANAAHNLATLPPRVATAVLRHISGRAKSYEADPSLLTVRERQVVDLIAEGLTNKEIAAQLHIEVATVKNHVHNILEKLEVSRRSEVVPRLRGPKGPAGPRVGSPFAVAGSTGRG